MADMPSLGESTPSRIIRGGTSSAMEIVPVPALGGDPELVEMGGGMAATYYTAIKGMGELARQREKSKEALIRPASAGQVGRRRREKNVGF